MLLHSDLCILRVKGAKYIKYKQLLAYTCPFRKHQAPSKTFSRPYIIARKKNPNYMLRRSAIVVVAKCSSRLPAKRPWFLKAGGSICRLKGGSVAWTSSIASSIASSAYYRSLQVPRFGPGQNRQGTNRAITEYVHCVWAEAISVVFLCGDLDSKDDCNIGSIERQRLSKSFTGNLDNNSQMHS